MSTCAAAAALAFASAGVQAAEAAAGGGGIGFDVPRTAEEWSAPPSPEAASLGTYADIGMDYASGRATIAVPLMQWESGALSVSLGLCYTASALRPEQPSGWIGAGWTLTGLGCVSRTVVGLPDEACGLTAFDDADDTPDLDGLMAILDGHADAMADRYSYTFPGGSGSFIIAGIGSAGERIIQLPQLPVRDVGADHDGRPG